MFKLKTFLLSLSLSLSLSLIFILFTLSIFNCLSCFAADETLTITTYYPSPYGSYNQFSVKSNTYLAYDSGSVGIGTTAPGTAKLAVLGGNVGIGTTNPTSKFEVARQFADGEGEIAVGRLTGLSNGAPTVGDAVALGFNVPYSTSGLNINTARIGAARESATASNYATALTFTTRSNGGALTEQMRITSSGNVGIGTTGPSALLHTVGGDVKFHGGATGSAFEIDTSGTPSDGINLTTTYTGTGSYGPLKFVLSGGEKVRIDANGNVGIGTTNPLTKLAFGGFGSVWVNNDAGNPFGMDTVSNELRLFVGGGDLVNYKLGLGTYNGTTFTPWMTLSNGNVGIGTASPAAGLEVNSAATDVVSFHNTGGTGLKLIGGQQAWTAISDARLKDTLGTISDASKKLLAIRPIYYRLKIDKKNSPRRVGLIAQDVQKVFPEAVDVDPKGYLGLRYTEITPLLIAGFQEQEQEIQTLKAKNTQLEARIAKLESNPRTVPSDKRLKKNITPFSDGLNVINRLNPIHYEYNGKAGLFKDTPAIGVVAQDVKDIAPYIVVPYKAKLEPQDKEETLLYSINSEPLTFVLINAVKQLNSQLQKAQEDIGYLKQENQDLKTEMHKLQTKTSPSRP